VSDIARLKKEETQAIVGIDTVNNDVYYLRYCLEDMVVARKEHSGAVGRHLRGSRFQGFGAGRKREVEQ
jgi:hypothetical protein